MNRRILRPEISSFREWICLETDTMERRMPEEERHPATIAIFSLDLRGHISVGIPARRTEMERRLRDMKHHKEQVLLWVIIGNN